ncbi:MAG: DNA modification methylase [Candidatus Uhrbacteria bacterium]|nr:DNA modification methylase [Patescibacteria group bacterium]MBU1907235.1 DNA modification methylase [Patescibacteria group bacterium]
MSEQKINVQHVDPNLLKRADYNPRKWDEKASEHLKESIKRHGFVDPVIVNGAPERKNIIIGGHFRTECAKKLGMETVPVVYINLPDIEKEKELNLRLNRNTGEWDMDLLKEFDINLLMDVGFNDSDLEDMWANLSSLEDDDFDDSKALHDFKDPVTQPGDIYQLGEHRLICGDALDLEVVQLLVGKEKIDMIYCDPPYNIALSYNDGIATKGKYGGKTDDKKSEREYAEFLQGTIQNAKHVASENAHVFYWCDQKYIGLLQSLYSQLGIKQKRVCLWIKNNFNMTPQVAFNKAYEPCVYGTIGKPYLDKVNKNLHEVMNQNVDSGNRCIDDIIDLFDVWLAKRDAATDYEHPTQKPITLHEKPLKRCTKPGDNVLDLFGGSGTTLLACEQMKRKAFLCEIEPAFCDVILKRFEEMTGIKPKKFN